MVSTASSDKFTHFFQYSESFSVKYYIVNRQQLLTQRHASLKNNLPGIEEEFLYVVGYEKRDHFAQNAFFCRFSNCHHFKALRASGFPLGL